MNMWCVMKKVAYVFSSRRRHTNWPRDWSSDVCSSDLPTLCVLSLSGQRERERVRERQFPGESFHRKNVTLYFCQSGGSGGDRETDTEMRSKINCCLN